jgi:hypothetical protein
MVFQTAAPKDGTFKYLLYEAWKAMSGNMDLTTMLPEKS